jgi:hypothetical protein
LVKKERYKYKVVVRSYGVVCVVRTTSTDARRPIRRILEAYLPGCEFVNSDIVAGHEFWYSWNKDGRDSLHKGDEVVSIRVKRGHLLDSLGSTVRIAVAEYAVGRVFVHAGVVGWKGKAIIIPARSFKGKTALTAELVRLGASYYSDEYAVLDQKARVHPFPKDLSLRGVKNDYDQVDHAVEALGGKAGKRPIPVGMVVITEYKKGAKWKPEVLNSGQGVMALIDNTVPIRRDPRFALPILSRVGSDAVILKSKRGEAELAAASILEMLEKTA